MENPVYESVVSRLAGLLGPGKALESGSGTRFTSAKRGKVTVYHTNLATGNHAEVAFDPPTMAKRMSMSEREFRSLIADLRGRTGRAVSPDPQFNWPRVGLVCEADVAAVVHAIESL